MSTAHGDCYSRRYHIDHLVPLQTALYQMILTFITHNVGASKRAAQVAWQVPYAALQARTEAGAVAPAVAPHVNPAAP